MLAEAPGQVAPLGVARAAEVEAYVAVLHGALFAEPALPGDGELPARVAAHAIVHTLRRHLHHGRRHRRRWCRRGRGLRLDRRLCCGCCGRRARRRGAPPAALLLGKLLQPLHRGFWEEEQQRALQLRVPPRRTSRGACRRAHRGQCQLEVIQNCGEVKKAWQLGPRAPLPAPPK